jgi:hypothetical protein
MRHHISYVALGVALAAGTSVAQAQTVIEQPGATVIARQPVEAAPIETVETVRTVESTTTPRRRMARSTGNRMTTTRTTVSERVVPAPLTPAVAAITAPTYTEVVQAPPAVVPAYPRLYDVVTPAPVAASPDVGTAVMPPYRYVYETDRILLIDPYTNIAVQAIPR